MGFAESRACRMHIAIQLDVDERDTESMKSSVFSFPIIGIRFRPSPSCKSDKAEAFTRNIALSVNFATVHALHYGISNQAFAFIRFGCHVALEHSKLRLMLRASDRKVGV